VGVNLVWKMPLLLLQIVVTKAMVKKLDAVAGRLLN
jgi:hypothetical protein